MSGRVRCGIGYDVHRFSPEADRPLVLGGVRLADGRGLAGHSDADVLLHAIADALLGAAALCLAVGVPVAAQLGRRTRAPEATRPAPVT